MESVKIVVLCVLAACTYGIVHDQVTARVCVEYFTVAHPPILNATEDPTLLALGWGVIATWWVGLPMEPAARDRRADRRQDQARQASLVGPGVLLLAAMGSIALIAGILGYVVAEHGNVWLPANLAFAISPHRASVFQADLSGALGVVWFGHHRRTGLLYRHGGSAGQASQANRPGPCVFSPGERLTERSISKVIAPRFALAWFTVALATFSSRNAAADGPSGQADADFKRLEEKRTDAYGGQLEAWLCAYLVDQYPERAAKAWKRDYTSIEAYLKSVEPNRAGWRGVIKPPELVKTGKTQRVPHPPLADLGAEWVTVPLGALTAEGVFAVPKGATREKPVPLVIVQHGIGSFPERSFPTSATAASWRPRKSTPSSTAG